MSYCSRSRLWQARAVSFNYPDEVYDHQLVESDVQFLQKQTLKERRETFFVFTEGINRWTYYLFQVKNEAYENDQRTKPFDTETYASHVYYFGRQGETSQQCQ